VPSESLAWSPALTRSGVGPNDTVFLPIAELPFIWSPGEQPPPAYIPPAPPKSGFPLSVWR
jgi:hypothetical protein